MTHTLLRWSALALATLTGSACFPVVMKYGVPDTDWETGPEDVWYQLSGKVVAEGTGEAIPDIQVAYGDEVDRTDADGAFELTGDGACDPCILTASDVDGADNGEWAEAEVEVEPEWRGALQTATDISIELSEESP